MKKVIFLLILVNFNLNAYITNRNIKSRVINPDKLKLLERYLFENSSLNTDAFLIIKHEEGDDVILFEKYANGYNHKTKHYLWSVSKSISSFMIGKMIDEGLLKLSTKVSDFYPDIELVKKNKPIKIVHLLNMLSGLDWQETYESNPISSNVVDMLYMNGHKDVAKYTSSIKAKYIPGKQFNYSSGETNLLMGMARIKLKDKYKDYMWNKIFTPLDIHDATMERDQAQTFIGSSYMYLNPRDLAKFGHLIVNKGHYKKRKVINEGWINLISTRPYVFSTSDFKAPSSSDPKRGYSFHWWLNYDLRYKDFKRRYTAAPDDLIEASGHWGQMLAVIPSQGITIVRLSEDKKKQIDKEKFYKLLMDSFR